MERRTLFLLLGLLALTGVVIFSLGVVTGMGMRVPAGALPVAMKSVPLEEEKSTPPPGESLAFNEGLKGATPTIEGLKIKEAAATEQTRSLLKRAERELKLEEVPPKKARKAPPPGPDAPSVQSRAKAPPAQAPHPPAAAEGRYTVQVFSSQHRNNARDLMLKLKKLGFDAFINQYQGPDRRTWFRVRVGRTSRSGAERLLQRLREEAKMKAPRIVQM
jgi:cell division septation protein DedD